MEEFATDPPNPSRQPLSRQNSLSPGIKYKNLGKCGLRISNIGLGTWSTFGAHISDETAEEIVTYAYENGINIFDTAEVYAAGKAEIVLGKILQKKEWRRSSYVVTTKLFWGARSDSEKGLSRKYIIEGLKASLDRLQLSYVDMVFVNKADPMCPMEEIVRAFTYCINHGMAMYWGSSRWSAVEIMEAYTVARQFNLIPPTCEQAEYHMLCRDKVELYLPELYHKIGIGTMAWSPLACGLLSGKYDDGFPLVARASLKGYTWLKDKIQSDEGKKRQSKLHEVSLLAEKLGCTFTQLSIAWSLKSENVHCVLLGAASVDQLAESVQALQVVPKLTTHVMNDLERILDNKPVRQPFVQIR